MDEVTSTPVQDVPPPPTAKTGGIRQRTLQPTPSVPMTIDIGCFIRNMRGGFAMDVVPDDEGVKSVLMSEGYVCSPEAVNGIWFSDAATVDDVNAAAVRPLPRGLLRISNRSLTAASLITGVNAGWSWVDADTNSFYLRKDN